MIFHSRTPVKGRSNRGGQTFAYDHTMWQKMTFVMIICSIMHSSVHLLESVLLCPHQSILWTCFGKLWKFLRFLNFLLSCQAFSQLALYSLAIQDSLFTVKSKNSIASLFKFSNFLVSIGSFILIIFRSHKSFILSLWACKAQ